VRLVLAAEELTVKSVIGIRFTVLEGLVDPFFYPIAF